jgi:hypothetical protein
MDDWSAKATRLLWASSEAACLVLKISLTLLASENAMKLTTQDAFERRPSQQQHKAQDNKHG